MADKAFGSCCETLKDVLEADEFEPLVTVGEDGILYMSVGMIDVEEEEPGMVEFPIFHCPFCGAKLQTEQEIAAKSGGAN